MGWTWLADLLAGKSLEIFIVQFWWDIETETVLLLCPGRITTDSAQFQGQSIKTRSAYITK